MPIGHRSRERTNLNININLSSRSILLLTLKSIPIHFPLDKSLLPLIIIITRNVCLSIQYTVQFNPVTAFTAIGIPIPIQSGCGRLSCDDLGVLGMRPPHPPPSSTTITYTDTHTQCAYYHYYRGWEGLHLGCRHVIGLDCGAVTGFECVGGDARRISGNGSDGIAAGI